MRKNLSVIVILAFVLSSCHGWFGGNRIRGNGNVTSQTRSVAGFSGIDVSGAINVYVKQDASESVRIETDANLMEYVVTTVENGVLRIYPDDHANLNPTRSINVYVSGKDFKYFEASGASDIRGESKIAGSEEMVMNASGASKIELDIKAPKVDGDISGASSLRLTGETKDIYLHATGASNAKCFELLAENADVDLSGASDANVFASVSVKGEASGASHVKYKGAATSVVVNTSGAGSVSKEN